MNQHPPPGTPVSPHYNTKPVPRLFSTREAAAHMGVSPNTIRKFRKYWEDGDEENGLRYTKVGEKLYKYDPEDLDAFMEKSRITGLNRKTNAGQPESLQNLPESIGGRAGTSSQPRRRAAS